MGLWLDSRAVVLNTPSSDNFSGRIEYLYVGLDDADFSMTDAASTTLDATQSFNDIHMVRAGLTYNFGW